MPTPPSFEQPPPSHSTPSFPPPPHAQHPPSFRPPSAPHLHPPHPSHADDRQPRPSQGPPYPHASASPVLTRRGEGAVHPSANENGAMVGNGVAEGARGRARGATLGESSAFAVPSPSGRMNGYAGLGGYDYRHARSHQQHGPRPQQHSPTTTRANPMAMSALISERSPSPQSLPPSIAPGATPGTGPPRDWNAGGSSWREGHPGHSRSTSITSLPPPPAAGGRPGSPTSAYASTRASLSPTMPRSGPSAAGASSATSSSFRRDRDPQGPHSPVTSYVSGPPPSGSHASPPLRPNSAYGAVEPLQSSRSVHGHGQLGRMVDAYGSAPDPRERDQRSAPNTASAKFRRPSISHLNSADVESPLPLGGAPSRVLFPEHADPRQPRERDRERERERDRGYEGWGSSRNGPSAARPVTGSGAGGGGSGASSEHPTPARPRAQSQSHAQASRQDGPPYASPTSYRAPPPGHHAGYGYPLEEQQRRSDPPPPGSRERERAERENQHGGPPPRPDYFSADPQRGSELEPRQSETASSRRVSNHGQAHHSDSSHHRRRSNNSFAFPPPATAAGAVSSAGAGHQHAHAPIPHAHHSPHAHHGVHQHIHHQHPTAPVAVPHPSGAPQPGPPGPHYHMPPVAGHHHHHAHPHAHGGAVSVSPTMSHAPHRDGRNGVDARESPVERTGSGGKEYGRERERDERRDREREKDRSVEGFQRSPVLSRSRHPSMIDTSNMIPVDPLAIPIHPGDLGPHHPPSIHSHQHGRRTDPRDGVVERSSSGGRKGKTSSSATDANPPHSSKRKRHSDTQELAALAGGPKKQAIAHGPAGAQLPAPIAVLPPPPKRTAPVFTTAELAEAYIRPPLLNVRNKPVMDALPPKDDPRRARFVGRFVYDANVEPTDLLDGRLLRDSVGSSLEVLISTKWLDGMRWEVGDPAAWMPNAKANRADGEEKDGDKEANVAADDRSWTLWDTPSIRQRKIWGTDVYTDDTDILAACIHSGWIRIRDFNELASAVADVDGKPGPDATLATPSNPDAQPRSDAIDTAVHDRKQAREDKVLRVTLRICPRLLRYQGTYRCGLRSRSWGNGHDGVSLMIENVVVVKDGGARHGRRWLKYGLNAAMLKNRRILASRSSGMHRDVADDAERSHAFVFDLQSRHPRAKSLQA